MHNLGMAFARSEHKRSLVVRIQSGTGKFVTGIEEDSGDVATAEGGGEMEIRVGEAQGRCIGVAEERWMGAEDAFDEESVARVDGASQANGGFDPGGQLVMVHQRSRL